MPHTDDRDKWEELQRSENRKRTIFKVVEPFLWLIMIIIMVAVCLSAMWAMGYFSVPNPIDAIPTFSY